MIEFEWMPEKYWDVSTKISYLQRKVIVYSIMYYKLNESCITDKQYDELSKQLVHMQWSVDKKEFEKTEYYYVMYDFDGSTGFDIPDRLSEKDKEYLTMIARMVLSLWNKEGAKSD